jgi:hypothetical protein
MENKLIYCEWEDITSTDSGWRTGEDAIEWSDSVKSIVRQTGFLIDQDENYLVLTCSYLPELELVGTTIRIPKATVTFIKEIPFKVYENTGTNTGS